MVRLAWTLVMLFLAALTNLLQAQNNETLQSKAFEGILGKPKGEGILIDSVLANSTAAKLKLQKGDSIQTLNGKETPFLES